jgi:hypothetical protein
VFRPSSSGQPLFFPVFRSPPRFGCSGIAVHGRHAAAELRCWRPHARKRLSQSATEPSAPSLLILATRSSLPYLPTAGIAPSSLPPLLPSRAPTLPPLLDGDFAISTTPPLVSTHPELCRCIPRLRHHSPWISDSCSADNRQDFRPPESPTFAPPQSSVA